MQSTKEMAKAVVEIIGEKCKGCEICVVICAQGCLELNQSVYNAKGFHPASFTYQGKRGACTGCGLCYMVCPDYAISAVKKLKKTAQHRERGAGDGETDARAGITTG